MKSDGDYKCASGEKLIDSACQIVGDATNVAPDPLWCQNPGTGGTADQKSIKSEDFICKDFDTNMKSKYTEYSKCIGTTAQNDIKLCTACGKEAAKPTSCSCMQNLLECYVRAAKKAACSEEVLTDINTFACKYMEIWVDPADSCKCSKEATTETTPGGKEPSATAKGPGKSSGGRVEPNASAAVMTFLLVVTCILRVLGPMI